MTAGALLLAALMAAPPATAGQEATAAKRRASPAGALQDAARALAAGDLDRARQQAAAHLKTHPVSVPARLLMARTHLAREEFDAAYDHLHHAWLKEPRNVDVLYYMGITAGRLAEMELHRLEQIAPDSARLYQVRAESLELQERPHEAAAEYEAALARQPDLVDALLGLAKLRRVALRCPEATELYKRAEKLRPTFQGAYGLGVCLQREGEDRLAAEQFAKATQRDPRDPLAWQGLGVAELKLGRLPRAIAHLQHAIELEPGMYEAYYALGQVYRAAGDHDRARTAFAAAQELQEKGPRRRRPPEPQPPR